MLLELPLVSRILGFFKPFLFQLFAIAYITRIISKKKKKNVKAALMPFWGRMRSPFPRTLCRTDRAAPNGN